jgi:asparagine synthase (glutamine-hydrolysing)
MCGIAGGYDLGGGALPDAVLRGMTDALAHRGPDGAGFVARGRGALGHRRLSIIDLSDAAAQPMANEAGDVHVVHNGEIYNFRELRAALEARGHRFRSRTDTEVIVHGYEEWGDRAVERFNGMFAFAVLDSRAGAGRLLLARDRYGIKPLYYRVGDGELLFASEIKALLRHPAVRARVCYAALSEYFTFQNIFSDRTLFDGVRLLPPGTQLVIAADAPAPVRQHRYWDFQFQSDGSSLSVSAAADHVYGLFERAVRRQLVADVPVGAYLSGGMDSGSITAIAAQTIPRISTFTGGFDLSSASGLELGFDERRAAEMLANQFKTEHYQMVLHAGDMEHVLPTLVWHLEDLRVGQSYPNYYLARLASRFVRVVLSGAGGDELFAGYPWRYFRGLASNAAASYEDAYYDYWQRLIPDQDRAAFFNPKTWAEVRHHPPRDAFKAVFAASAPPGADLEEMINASLYFESKTFLHGLFVVEDKLSMAHSLETRVPFLDNDLVDFACRIPPRLKLRDLARAPHVDEDEIGKTIKYRSLPSADGKIVLREAMKRIMPDDVTVRAKQGFAAPDASWFRGESIDYVNRLLRNRGARIYEFVDPSYVSRVLDEHVGGRINHRLLIWSLLSFEWWCRTFLDHESAMTNPDFEAASARSSISATANCE